MEGNCYFICIGYDPGANNAWLETQLKSPESQNADWRFIYCHKPIYSIGSHGANGTTSEGSSITNFRSLCDKYNVTAVFTGHDHSYQRTYYWYNGTAITKSNIVTMSPDTHGTFYVVCGGGGAPLYNTGTAAWSAAGISTYHYCVIDAGIDRLTFSAKKSDGSVIDQFTINRKGTSLISCGKSALQGSSMRFFGSQIHYQIPGVSGSLNVRVSITLYTTQGKLAARLVDARLPAGNYALDLSRKSFKGKRTGAGTYLCTMEIEGVHQTIGIFLKE